MPFFEGVEVTLRQRAVIDAMIDAHFNKGRWLRPGDIDPFLVGVQGAASPLTALVDLGLVVTTEGAAGGTLYRLKVQG